MNSHSTATNVRSASAPARALPPGAWDCHAHVFGPYDRYPLAADSRYQPPLAPCADYLAMLRTAGFAHGVLVHASANGFDNAATLDAVCSEPRRLRAVAVVPEASSDADWQRWHEQGARGLRFTETGATYGAASSSGTLGLDALQRLAPRLRAMGWHAQVWAKCEYLRQSWPWLSQCEVPLVIDHMGMFEPARGVHDAAFQALLQQLASGQVWVKMTTVRVTQRRWNDASDVRPFHDALLRQAPERLLWGSDWPYIRLDQDLPDVGALIDLFDRWIGSEVLRQQILVDNPRQLYGDQPA